MSTRNPEQDYAFKKLTHWITEGNEPYYFLSGQAGTGKTWLASQIAEHASTELKRIVYITATTNKAAAVLNRMGKENDACTIYSFLGLVLRNDYKTGKQFIMRGNTTPRIERNAIVIIDEASMVDSTLMEYINQATKQYQLKILFLGDAFQLPPVNSGSMPVTSSSIPVTYLTQIMRSEQRKDLEGTYGSARSMVVDGAGIYLPPDSDNITVVNKIGSKDYLENLLKEDPHAVILGYTNRAVDSANILARELQNLPPMPIKGDTLVAEDVVIINSERLAYIGQEFEVLNSEQTHFTFDGVSYPAHYIHTTCGLRFLRPDNPHDRRACLKVLSKDRRWPEYFHMKETLADLRFTHASTVHKSQGSTYKNVFVVTSDILVCPDADTRRRLLYVAYTRASNHLHVMID